MYVLSFYFIFLLTGPPRLAVAILRASLLWSIFLLNKVEVEVEVEIFFYYS